LKFFRIFKVEKFCIAGNTSTMLYSIF